VAAGEAAEVGEGDALVAEAQLQLTLLVVLDLQQPVGEDEVVHHLQGRGVDGVAAKIAEEVGVLLEDHHAHPAPGKKKAQQDAGRTAAGDRDVDGRPVSHRGRG
jgi:hypothetical protein